MNRDHFDKYDPTDERMESAYLDQELPFESKPRTNADRIRSMSDEELAKAIMCPMEFAKTKISCRRETGQGSCDDCCLAWLRSEAT